MTQVYFSKTIEPILEKLNLQELGNNIAIKLHFGEKGCDTYIKPELVKKIYNKLQELNKKATLIECNVLYKGSRTNSTEHIKTAKEHGFDFAPIDILDGEHGDEFTEVEIENGLIKKAKLGKGILKYDSMIVLTHFKGHICAGYGGALKNIGMGLGSRGGKLDMHSDTKLSINPEMCIGCEKCIQNCNYNAISIINKKAKIDNEKCVGCAMCTSVCPEKAVRWTSSTPEVLQKKIIDYARAVKKIIPNMIFINVLEDITKGCDCHDFKQKPMMEDIGILGSRDIVGIDKASLDLVNKYSNNKFDKIYNIDKSVQTDYGSKKGLGEEDYNLIRI